MFCFNQLMQQALLLCLLLLVVVHCFDVDTDVDGILDGYSEGNLEPKDSSSYTSSTSSSVGEARIVGGDTPSRDRYPYFVRLDYLSRLHCGAFLVHSDIIVTAGHCAPNLIFRQASFSAHVNAYTIYSSYEGQIALTIADSIVHPSYNRQTREYDVAVLRLSAPVSVESVEMNRNAFEPHNGADLTILGVGDTREGGSPSAFLQAATVEKISTGRCNARGSYGGAVRDGTMFCAAGFNRDSCQGDSGGPIIQRLEVDGVVKDVVVGIVSWGEGCARPDYPGVYARMTALEGWIGQQIQRMTQVSSGRSPQQAQQQQQGVQNPPQHGIVNLLSPQQLQQLQWITGTNLLGTPVPTNGPTPVPTSPPTPVPTPETPAPTSTTPVPTPLPTEATPAPTPTPIPIQTTPAPTPLVLITPESTTEPTTESTIEPTSGPTPSRPTPIPTFGPTPFPSPESTSVPTVELTTGPTSEPTSEPTTEPTSEPTSVPTEEPTAIPTDEPTAIPTDEPTHLPTEPPTAAPVPTDVSDSCGDDNVNTFFVAPFIGNRSCKWLSEKPGPIRSAFCRSSQPAYSLCEETCGKCVDNCADDNSVVMTVFGAQQTCAFVATLSPSSLASLCAPGSDPYIHCQETCDSCVARTAGDVIGGRTGPMEVSNSAALDTSALLEDATRPSTLVGARSRDGDGDCKEDPKQTFKVNGVTRDCEWLSRRQTMQTYECAQGEEAYWACPMTCGSCNLAGSNRSSGGEDPVAEPDSEAESERLSTFEVKAGRKRGGSLRGAQP